MISALIAFIVALLLFLPTSSLGWYIVFSVVTALFVFLAEKMIRIYGQVSMWKEVGIVTTFFCAVGTGRPY